MFKTNTCYQQEVDNLLVNTILEQFFYWLLVHPCVFVLAKYVSCNFIITPESVALKSSASSLGPAGLGSSGLLALIKECVH